MRRLLINYDLHRPGQNYDDLFRAIKALGQAWHVLYSTWAVQTEYSCTQVRDHLKRHIDANDKLAVVQISDWATIGIANPADALG